MSDYESVWDALAALPDERPGPPRLRDVVDVAELRALRATRDAAARFVAARQAYLARGTTPEARVELWAEYRAAAEALERAVGGAEGSERG